MVTRTGSAGHPGTLPTSGGGRLNQPPGSPAAACIPIEEVRNFWAEVQELARRFAQMPRAGDQVYGFVAGLYPTDAPTLPDAEHTATH